MAQCVALGIFLLAFAQCGPASLKQQSPVDTPQTQYSLGQSLLESGDLVGARRAFERASALDEDYAGGLVGLALISTAKQDYFQARQYLEKAIHKDGDFADAFIALGRLEMAEGMQRQYPIGKWLKRSRSAFAKAQKKDPANMAALFYGGIALKNGGELADARQLLNKILVANDQEWVGAAMAEIELIQTVERAAPGTRLGGQIGFVEQVSRAELAVLLLEELKLEQLVERRIPSGEPRFQPPQVMHKPDSTIATDYSESWARGWIERVLALGISGLTLFPDGNFSPDQPITRAQYALVNQSILEVMTADPSLPTRYVGEDSRFPDVRGDNFAYNAIALSTERGIMEVDKLSGRFHPDKGVSGAEALDIIRRLQNAVRIGF